MSSTDAVELKPGLRRVLLLVARGSVEYGVHHGRPQPVRAADYEPPLREVRATFVTLHLDGDLRGCIGTCWPQRPMVEDVAANAYAAAFMDPRFPRMTAAELPGIHIHISLLSVPERMQFRDAADLLAQVRPGVDGLLLEAGGRRGTLLPAVWEALPDVADFVRTLKLKAGLPADYWADDLTVFRYTAESFEED